MFKFSRFSFATNSEPLTSNGMAFLFPLSAAACMVGNHGQDYRTHFSFCYLACQIKGQEMMKKPQNSPGLADFPPSFLTEFGAYESEGIKNWL